MPSQRNWMRRIEARIEELEARVEAVEPEKHSCGECKFFAPSAAYGCLAEGGLEIHRVWDECLACNKFRPKEPEDTDATIRKLRSRLEDISEGGGVVIQRLHRELDIVERELAEAKAEVERLRKLWLSERNCSGKLHEERNNAQKELASYTASVNADAEIGRLVRGMRRGGNLRCSSEGWVASDYANYGEDADDPAEALRAIQEGGDD